MPAFIILGILIWWLWEKYLKPDEYKYVPAKSSKPPKIKNQEIRMVMDYNGEPWFVAQDVCGLLSLKDSAVAKIDDDEKMIKEVQISGKAMQVWTLNEAGLYSLAFSSDKPEAKKFRKWITSEVLPTIRKTGKYDSKATVNFNFKK